MLHRYRQTFAKLITNGEPSIRTYSFAQSPGLVPNHCSGNFIWTVGRSWDILDWEISIEDRCEELRNWAYPSMDVLTPLIHRRLPRSILLQPLSPIMQSPNPQCPSTAQLYFVTRCICHQSRVTFTTMLLVVIRMICLVKVCTSNIDLEAQQRISRSPLFDFRY